jgi:predicted nicotinamide N-methyase
VNAKDFIRANTTILSPPLVPEIKLHLAHEAVPLWQKTEEELGELGLPPPFWAFAWAGGQALARHILDAGIVAGAGVLDVATGSGLVAIAAMKGGAVRAAATEIDEFAVAAAAMNAAVNGVCLDIQLTDVLNAPPPVVDFIFVGDLFYERSIAERCFDWLARAEMQGSKVLIGDSGRSYLPKDKLEKIAEYNVPVTRDLEDAEIKRSAVWRLRPNC